MGLYFFWPDGLTWREGTSGVGSEGNSSWPRRYPQPAKEADLRGGGKFIFSLEGNRKAFLRVEK